VQPSESAHCTVVACPKCRSIHTRLSTMWVLADLKPGRIGRVPFRCRECRDRFFVALALNAPRRMYPWSVLESSSAVAVRFGAFLLGCLLVVIIVIAFNRFMAR
jgi:hypothetical protein